MNTTLNLNKKNLFESAPILKAVISLVLPTILSQLITVVYNMADTFYIGQLGDPNQVAASTIAMPIFMMLTGIANLFGVGGASLISRSLGNSNYKRAKHTSSFCIYVSSIIAIVYGLTVLFIKPVVLPLLGTDEYTYGYTSIYLLWTVTIGALPTVLSMLLAHLVRSEGYSKEASIGLSLGGLLNIALDPLFIFVFKLEIQGAAIATMLSNLVATAFFIIFLIRKRKTTVINFSIKNVTFKDSIPKEVVMVGFTSFIMAVMGTFSNMVLNGIMASYSNQAIAGMGIAKRIDLLAYAIAHGMTQGVLPLIAYNYASGNKKRMTDTIKITIILSLIVAVASTLLLYFCATPVTRLFIDDDLTVSYGRDFLKIIALACPITMINNVAITVFQAIGRKVRPLILSISRKGVTDIPVMFMFNSLIGVSGIPWAVPTAEGIGLIFSMIFIILLLKNLKKTPTQKV